MRLYLAEFHHDGTAYEKVTSAVVFADSEAEVREIMFGVATRNEDYFEWRRGTLEDLRDKGPTWWLDPHLTTVTEVAVERGAAHVTVLYG